MQPYRLEPMVILHRSFVKNLGTICLFYGNQTHNDERLPIYHTNVMMCIADGYAIVCMDTIDDEGERQLVELSIKKSGKELIEITEEQKKDLLGICFRLKVKLSL